MAEETPPTEPATPEPEKTFTQAELDAKIAERLTRERQKYSDYNDLKAKASRLDEIEASQQSDLERAVATAKAEGRTEALATANERLIAAEARALAAEAKFRNPATAVRLLDLSSVTVDDDGTVDSDAVKSLLDDLGKNEPYLLTDEAPPVPTPGQAGIGVIGNGAPTDPISADMAQIEADIRAATKR